MFLGGWTTSRLAVGETKLEAVLYGVILWGVLFLGMIWLIGTGVRVGFGAMVSGAAGMNLEDPTAAASPDALNKLMARYTRRSAARSSWRPDQDGRSTRPRPARSKRP